MAHSCPGLPVSPLPGTLTLARELCSLKSRLPPRSPEVSLLDTGEDPLPHSLQVCNLLEEDHAHSRPSSPGFPGLRKQPGLHFSLPEFPVLQSTLRTSSLLLPLPSHASMHHSKPSNTQTDNPTVAPERLAQHKPPLSH